MKFIAVLLIFVCGTLVAGATPIQQQSVAHGNVPSAKSSGPSNGPIDQISATSPSSNRLYGLPQGEIYELEKLRMRSELQEEVVYWAQQRFWIIALAVLIIGFFGTRAFVREFVSSELKDAMRAAAEAQAASVSARESIKEVRAEANKYKDLVEAASETAASVNERLKELGSRIDSEGARSIAAADIKVSSINKQLEELERTVSQLASDSERNRKILLDAESRLEKARENAKATENEFEANSAFNVTVVQFSNPKSGLIAGEIGAKLTSSGFKVSKSTWGKSVPNTTKGARVSYQPIAKHKAEEISGIAREIFIKHGLGHEVTLVEKDKPISNSDAHVVVFFE